MESYNSIIDTDGSSINLVVIYRNCTPETIEGFNKKKWMVVLILMIDCAIRVFVCV